MLSSAQIQQFQEQGYLRLPAFSSSEFCERVIEFAQRELDSGAQPIEYETDTRYPGAPSSREAEGGHTARRLLQAYARSEVLAAWAKQAKLSQILRQLLGEGVRLSQAHHNCIMTKQARFSSHTGWHRDSRYWHFQRPELISVWLALRDETMQNGCLQVLPSSHTWQLEADQLDEAQFLKHDHPRNAALLSQAQAVSLNQGDVLLFSSNLLHAAGNNQTTQTKFSLVFTYRAADNPPEAGSRSARLAEIPLVNV